MANIVDWKEIPAIKDDLERLEKMRVKPEENVSAVNIGDWFREPEKEYLLRVKVTDVDLAQVVLTRAFSGESRVPGMDIIEVNVDPDGFSNEPLSRTLRRLADKIDSGDYYG